MADVDYGPLAALIGTWKGDRGMDVAPEPDGVEKSPYYETIIFEAGGDLTNAKQQHLAIVTYTQIVTRKATDEVFHHQYGYWLYDAVEGTVMQSISIPRAVMVLAGGKAVQSGDGQVEIEVSAEAGKLDFGVLQSPFMERNAKTTAFTHKLTVKEDQLHYVESTSLNIYDKHFDHTDENTLTRVAD